MEADLGDRLDREMAIEHAGEVTFARLHVLVKRGYIAELGTDSGAIWLNHSSKRFQYATLILYPDGKIVSAPPGFREIRIHREEEAEFAAFVRTVPTPTFWDKSRPTRTRIFVWLFFAALLAVSWWVSEIAKEAFR